ncbi:Acyl-CoA reductase (LuxC) [Soonwooa buanensis]|uniref:Acyl-CoA reductase (LuxC) n=1 Tax=Soonwooa buanensis TaxID=619805 RepID=A0A1T5F368_9FLAO|nr:acyl-CoA reductase [Soonwooa buanensis]SKB90541.1 Acyl-CoA reductase (LuxC) [Soonwooa buanensis]
MINQDKIYGLTKVGSFLNNYLTQSPDTYDTKQQELQAILKRSEVENPWFDEANLRFSLESWASLLNASALETWLSKYHFESKNKRVGLILAGNIPMVGWHDVMSVILSGNIPVIKLSSKDRWLIPFLLKLWNDNAEGGISYELVERLENFDAVIATGSNNTARYLEYYFKDHKSIIRKNRTSVAVVSENDSDEDLRKLADDIFIYYGLGCRNVTRLLIPEDYKLDRLFENFIDYQSIINHNKYANNYDYNRAVFLLNQDKFWDNNFVMLKEDDKLFSPLAVINFSRYKSLDEVKAFINDNEGDIQAVVTNLDLGTESVKLGEAQQPSLDTYADNVDTMAFLAGL